MSPDRTEMLTRPIAEPNDAPPEPIDLAAPGWHVVLSGDGTDLVLDAKGNAQLVFIASNSTAGEPPL